MELDHNRKEEVEMIPAPERSCIDCRTTKTPLWRSGPAGRKSLCNACGIRHRKKQRAVAGEEAAAIKKKPKLDNMAAELTQRLMAFGEAMFENQRSQSEAKKKQSKKKMGDVERAALLLMSLSEESSSSSSSDVFAS